jgi:hypothetical protein
LTRAYRPFVTCLGVPVRCVLRRLPGDDRYSVAARPPARPSFRGGGAGPPAGQPGGRRHVRVPGHHEPRPVPGRAARPGAWLWRPHRPAAVAAVCLDPRPRCADVGGQDVPRVVAERITTLPMAPRDEVLGRIRAAIGGAQPGAIRCHEQLMTNIELYCHQVIPRVASCSADPEHDRAIAAPRNGDPSIGPRRARSMAGRVDTSRGGEVMPGPGDDQCAVIYGFSARMASRPHGRRHPGRNRPCQDLQDLRARWRVITGRSARKLPIIHEADTGEYSAGPAVASGLSVPGRLSRAWLARLGGWRDRVALCKSVRAGYGIAGWVLLPLLRPCMRALLTLRLSTGLTLALSSC